MRSALDEILNRVDILDVVTKYVKLRRAGKNFMGLCPFHQEKTPSFTISTEKQIFYCFGCHEGGNVINFIMKYENLSFKEAVETLARQYGIKITSYKDSRRMTILDAMGKLADYFQNNLKNSPHAMDYLLKRGITEQIIDEFRIGYSDRKLNIGKFLKETEIPKDILMSTGIIKASEKEIYDIFRGRIVIPICDINKRVIGFGARAIEKNPNIPKYINSPESPFFSKRTSLFGIDKTRKYIQEADEVYIVEGYFDFISLYTKGIKNTVATLGTAVTKEQLIKLKNYTENITLMLDGDEAGLKSSLRLIELITELEINSKMVALPKGYDPDSFIREKGKEALNKVLDEKKPILDYYLDFHMKRYGIETLEGRLSFIKNVLPYVEKIKDNVTKNLYIKRISELTKVEEHIFWDGTERKELKPLNTQEQIKDIIGKKVIGILINNPNLIEFFKEKGVIKFIKDNNTKGIIEKIMDFYEKNLGFEVNAFISTIEEEHLKSIACECALMTFDCGEEELEKILMDYLKHVEKKFIKEELKKITQQLLEAEKRGDDLVIMGLLDEKRQVLSLLKN
ncbi:MAG TPA: DNA primase [Syntrophorhabdaceae bacterium]|nr:DNA primase [Syntrophorhabdaceae bacterium]